MKNKNFFYLQYDKINWENQEKTKINSQINDFIIKDILLKHNSRHIKVFDIGFGIGFFLKMLQKELPKKYEEVTLSGCEPSDKNYSYFAKKGIITDKSNFHADFRNLTFQNVKINGKFDFVTAIYVFPHFSSEDLSEIAKKIHSILEPNGKFVLVVVNDAYLERKLKDKKDLFIENNIIELDGKKYKEILHYSDIPEIGKVIDYNREEGYYLDLFKKSKLNLIKKESLDDNGSTCTIFVFEKQ